MTTVRPFESRDYPDCVRIWNLAITNQTLSVDQMRHDDELVEPPFLAGRLVAVNDADQVVGAAQYEQPVGMYNPQKFYLWVYVDPAHERQGVGDKLYAALHQHLQQFDPIAYLVEVCEAHSHALAFATARDFHQIKTDWQMVADLTTWDPTPHLHRLERMAEQNIVLKSIAQLGNTEAVNRQFFEVFNQARIDVPRTEPATPLSWEQFESMVVNAPDYLAAGTFLAIDGDEVVGMTMSWTAGDPPELHTGLTAVNPSHRGRGIASAMKVAALSWGKADGRVKAVTDNDINNVEMLAVNEALGYQRQPAIFALTKTFQTS